MFLEGKNMAKVLQKGKFLIDDSIPQSTRDDISKKVLERIDEMKGEVSDREDIIKKRQDFYENGGGKWTNVVGQVVKQQEGHIMAAINYIYRFCKKIEQALTNHPPKIKIVPKDESNDIEVVRAEAVEQAVYDTFRDNKFLDQIFKKLASNQVRDADFMLDCKVMEDKEKKRIVISPNEDVLKVMIGWDDAAGTSFSFAVFSDQISIQKIKRDFGYDAEAMSDEGNVRGDSKGSHAGDEYGMLSSPNGKVGSVPSGKSKLPKALVKDYWGYEVIKDEVKVVNLVYINKELVQFIVTDYKDIPKFVGHSFVVAGKPWSKGFIDDLTDPQVELNDRSGEEGDLVRIGSHMKFLAINMPDFDASSVLPGSGQVIYIEGEGADFKPLQMSITPFPSSDYITRTMDHLHTLGIPKIALASGTAPYTGKVGAIQYQPFIDLVDELRVQWEVVFRDLVTTIQEYFIAYFPEMKQIMTESITDPVTGEVSDGETVIRDIEFDWDNILPLSRSDKVVDAATLRDRGLISVSTTLEEAGFRDPQKEIKKIKKEGKDAELMALMPKFQQFSPGVVQATLEAQKKMSDAQEANAETIGTMNEAATAASKVATKAPIQNTSQNDGRRGVLSATGTPTGQTATPAGAVAQEGQNLNAKGAV
jgi:hypothetical protein